ncbi:MAG: glycosyltransferase family 1 protein [Nitrospinae bacterium]|nr:glycosyltransferase family 1 protein [Nitrospinota bacterium]
MRVLIATDAWRPQVNGVVRTIENVAAQLEAAGHGVRMLTPEGRRTAALPYYPEIRLARLSQKEITNTVADFRPDHVHVSTEGPIGLAVRRWCMRRGLPFTTGYHTRFPEFLAARFPLPGIQRIAYAVLRRFHGPGLCVMVPTPSMARELGERGFNEVRIWTRGVDHARFRPLPGGATANLPGPRLVYVGRLSVEKNIEAFLGAETPGTKVVIGDGPSRKSLEARYPEAHFTGYLFGDDLVREISGCDVFVFPSRSDTFGLVMIEAMACGLPVAAYPAPGPIDVVEHGVSGWLDQDLSLSIENALSLDPAAAIARARKYTWAESARQFAGSLAPIAPETIDAALRRDARPRTTQDGASSTGKAR